MTDVLSDVIWNDDLPYEIPFEDTEPLAAAITATGELLSTDDHGEDNGQQDRYAAAKAAVEACMAATTARQAEEGTVPASESVLLSLHRILRAAKPKD
jgi:hypothetical protein